MALEPGSKTFKSVAFEPFPKQLLEQYGSTGDGLQDLTFFTPKINDNDEITLIGEKERSESTTTGTGGQSSTTYYFEDVVVIRLGTDGKIKWAADIPKRQVSQSVGKTNKRFSYFSIVSNDYVHIIYNDNIKNTDVNSIESGKTFRGNEGNTVIVSLDNSGRPAKQILTQNLDEEIMITPRMCKVLNDKSALLFGLWKSKHQFAKLTFK
jgi:hypothetical protein